LSGPFLVGVLVAPAAVSRRSDDGDGGADGFTIKDPGSPSPAGSPPPALHPGIYWTHNDSDDGAFLYAVDSKTGKTVATVTMTGVGKPRDVEAISIGPERIYVGDIGDNLDGTWDHVWIYELPEPKVLKDQTIRATQYVVKYSDGARDAESLIVHPKTGRVYIIDKKEDGGHLFEGPAKLSSSGTNTSSPSPPSTSGPPTPPSRPTATARRTRLLRRPLLRLERREDQAEGRLDVPLQGQGESVSVHPRRVQADVRERGHRQSGAGRRTRRARAGETASRPRGTAVRPG
jgi:hypothetical protein